MAKMRNSIHISYRDYDNSDLCVSSAIEEAKYNNLLAQALSAQPQDDTEREILEDYIAILKQIASCYTEINKITAIINSLNKSSDAAKKISLEELCRKNAAVISSREQELFALECSYSEPLKRILERNNETPRKSEEKKEEDKTLQEAQQKKSVKAKSVIASIPLSILGAVEVHLVYGLMNLIIAILFWLVSNIPILSILVEWLFRIREDSPDMVAMLAATVVAYLVLAVTAEHIIKSVETRKLTLILTGIYLTVLNILFVIINLVYHDPILGNILLSIAGIAIFFKGKNT